MSSPAERSEGKGTQVEKQYYVYMLASGRNGTLYTGITSDLMGRVWQHKNNVIEGFTKKHGVHILVWFEIHQDVNSAIAREKQHTEHEQKREPDGQQGFLRNGGHAIGAVGAQADPVIA